MKRFNFTLSRIFKTRIGLALTAVMLMGSFNAPVVMAAEDTEEIVTSLECADSEVVPLADATTYYFIKKQQFTFTGSNTGNTFDVPRRCQARLMTAFVAMDDGREEHVTVEVWNTSGYKEQSFQLTTNTAKVTVFNIGGGEHYLRYYGRSGVKYTAVVQLYTWDY